MMCGLMEPNRHLEDPHKIGVPKWGGAVYLTLIDFFCNHLKGNDISTCGKTFTPLHK